MKCFYFFFKYWPILDDLSKNWKICLVLESRGDRNLGPYLVPVNPNLRDHVPVRQVSAINKTEQHWYQNSWNHSRNRSTSISSPTGELSSKWSNRSRFPWGPKWPPTRVDRNPSSMHMSKLLAKNSDQQLQLIHLPRSNETQLEESHKLASATFAKIWTINAGRQGRRV